MSSPGRQMCGRAELSRRKVEADVEETLCEAGWYKGYLKCRQCHGSRKGKGVITAELSSCNSHPYQHMALTERLQFIEHQAILEVQWAGM